MRNGGGVGGVKGRESGHGIASVVHCAVVRPRLRVPTRSSTDQRLSNQRCGVSQCDAMRWRCSEMGVRLGDGSAIGCKAQRKQTDRQRCGSEQRSTSQAGGGREMDTIDR